jgi:hypothetical protein
MRRIFASAGISLAVVLSVTAGAAAKPGPAHVQAHTGTVVRDNTALKPSVPAVPALGAAFGKAPLAAPPALTGYTVVTSAILDNPNGAQSNGTVSCPAGTVALGGGAIGGSFAVQQNINGSVPLVQGGIATGWDVWMDNTTGADSDFNVWAVCAKKPKAYAVVQHTIDNPPGTQVTDTLQCPLNARGKPGKVLGGGGVGEAAVTGQDINTSVPIGGHVHAWRVDMNNNTASDENSTVFTVCGNEKSWKVVSGAAVDNPPSTQTQVDVNCPAGLTAVGGGAFSNSFSTLVNLNTTFPASASDWRSYENNASGADTSVTPWEVCVL